MSSVFAGSDPLVTFALGVGKAAKARYAAQPLDDIVARLKKLPLDISLKYQLRALRVAAKPGKAALQSNVLALGRVTGNLLASIDTVERKYRGRNKANLPIALVAVGFRRPVNAGSQRMAEAAFEGGGVMSGPNRAYHSHLVEYGTRPKTPGIKTKRVNRRRVVLGGRIRTLADQRREESGKSRRILSSGFSADANAEARKGKRRFFKGRGQYPVDFIATGTVRGAAPRFPLRNAYNSSRAAMASILDSEMRKALTKAIKETIDKYGTDFGA